MTPADLRARCRDWPARTVADAVRRALSGADTVDVAPLVAHWLTTDTDDNPPPLSAQAAAAIWRELQASRQ